MFLFENFTYDYTWASLNYNWYYDSSGYFNQFLNQLELVEYVFKTRKLYSAEHNNNRYNIKAILLSDIFADDTPEKIYKQAVDKLKELGKCITIDSVDNFKGIDITYDISKDEKRWKSEHERVYSTMDEIISDYIPNAEQWLWMLDAKYNNKNPNLLFMRINDIESIGTKYIISLKMNWYLAQVNLEERLSELIATKKYDVPIELTKILRTYANEKYEIPEEIQSIIETYSATVKNKSKSDIPAQMIKVAKKLDDNIDVQSYQILPSYSYAIDVVTSNNNIGRIFIEKEDDGTYKGMWKVSVKLPNAKETSILPTTFPGVIRSRIDSAVRTIHKNDPNELNKVVIKYK